MSELIENLPQSSACYMQLKNSESWVLKNETMYQKGETHTHI